MSLVISQESTIVLNMSSTLDANLSFISRESDDSHSLTDAQTCPIAKIKL